MPKKMKTTEDNSHNLSPVIIGLIGVVIAALLGALGGSIAANKSADAQIKSAQEAARAEITSAWINVIVPVQATQTAEAKITPTPSSPASMATPTNTTTLPAVYPSSISFIAGEWNPRRIDLSTSGQEGIHAEIGLPLKLINLTVYVPDELQYAYNAQAQVYVNDDGLIGRTNMVALVPGAVSLGDFIPSSYINPSDKTSWLVMDTWNEFTILVYVFKKGETNVFQLMKTVIRLTNDTNSWYITPPYASLINIVYQVNDGEKAVADLRTLEIKGISTKPGDRLRIWEIWYRTLADDNTKQVYLEAYLSSGSYDSTTLLKTAEFIFDPGVHNLITDTPLDWSMKAGKTSLIMTLSRDEQNVDSIILDRYEIPLHASE
jgi:hypothetical protein